MIGSFFRIARDSAAMEYGRQNVDTFAKLAKVWRAIKVGFWVLLGVALAIATYRNR